MWTPTLPPTNAAPLNLQTLGFPEAGRPDGHISITLFPISSGHVRSDSVEELVNSLYIEQRAACVSYSQQSFLIFSLFTAAIKITSYHIQIKSVPCQDDFFILMK